MVLKTACLLLLALALGSPAWAVEQGGVAPLFSAREIVHHKKVDLAKLKGKVVLIDFWATWCPPCRMEIPHLIDLQDGYKKKGLVVVGISLDRGGAPMVQNFIKQAGINYKVIMDDGELADRYGGIQGIPTAFLIGKDGRIIKWYVGYHPKEEFEQDIKTAL